MRYCCALALFSVNLLCACQTPRTREVTVVIDGVTYKGTVTEQPSSAPTPAASQPVTPATPAAQAQVQPNPQSVPSDKLMMTAKWPLNQPATQYPDETRSLNAGNPFTPKPIAESFRTIFGPNHLQFNTTMPVTIVDSKQTPQIFAPVKITTNWGSDDASHVPVIGGKIEGGANAPADSDRHILVYDKATGLLHELFGVSRDPDGHYSALAYRRWDTAKPQVGTPGQNSADAAGLPIVPLLLRYDEAASGSIHHALRFTVNLSRANTNGGVFTPPASHAAGQNWSSPAYMGQRLRLRADFDASKFSKMDQVIVTCLKTYGIVVADNGISGLVVADDDRRWNQDDLQHLGGSLRLSDFIPVNSGPIIDSSGATAK